MVTRNIYRAFFTAVIKTRNSMESKTRRAVIKKQDIKIVLCWEAWSYEKFKLFAFLYSELVLLQMLKTLPLFILHT
jgi:hypothetical protein